MSSRMELFASCHCGAVQQNLRPRFQKDPLSEISKSLVPLKISLCHCSACRHATGLLCTSYLPVAEPQDLSSTSAYPSIESEVHRYFCSTCGCHVFRSRGLNNQRDYKGSDVEGSWEVATGVLNDVAGTACIERHVNVAETQDGGASSWIREQHGLEVLVYPGDGPDQFPRVACGTTTRFRITSPGSLETGDLQASCACGNVRFHVTRPDRSSKLPKSPFPDLMIPYFSQDPQIPNPENKTWWLRGDDAKYLAGTCACRSCRLTSGFEIQTWAFIPRSNIHFHIGHTHRSQPMKDVEDTPLDFSKLPAGILRSYESSSGVVREFCGNCGATVFWHDKWRPDLVDVSVGLFDATEGARAENWLDWWTERVSFAEDSKTDRPAKDDERKFDLISSLEKGLLAWGMEIY